MAIKATQLRQNLYQLLDKVLQDGQPLEVERGGKILKIIPAEQRSKFDSLEEHSTINGGPETLLNLDWSEFWSEPSNLKGKLPKKSVTRQKKGKKNG